MADFRKWFTALAMLALFAGLAVAQTGTTQPQMVCNSVAQVTPTLRAEGVTELVGDIVITCTGGNYVPPGTQIPQANLVVGLTAPVTSRLSSDGSYSEALLLIDEPNSGLQTIVPGFGPAAQQNVCTNTQGGCPEYATQVGPVTIGTTTTNVVVATDTNNGSALQGPNTGLVAGKNVFVGVVSGNNVSFNGIPILPPVTTGVQRVYRITNIRVNAGGASAASVSAFLSFSGPTSLPISNPNLTVGVINTGLNPSVTVDKAGGVLTSTGPLNAFTQCNLGMNDITAIASPGANVAMLNFAENFPSAFKTRVGISPVLNMGGGTSQVTSFASGRFTSPSGSSYLGTSSAQYYGQNVPGALYQSESGFILKAGGLNAGIADWGTRLKASFANLPSGATIYVSRYNVKSFTTSANNATGVAIGAPPAPPDVPSIAVFQNGGAASGITEFTKAQSLVYGNVEVVALTRASDGTATAVWEVTNTNPSANETFSFAVYIAYKGNQTGTNLPTPGSAATVTLSYAPIDGKDTTTGIPRFIVGPASTAQPLVNIVKCQTVLLFPYLTSAVGFDTGVAIENTSLDPLGTVSSSGSCTLNFYGQNAPALPTSCVAGSPTCLGPILAGSPDPSKAAFQLSSVAPNFTGYMFATCDFQYAHGFAFISDVGVRNFTMGYLALIVNNGVQLNQRGQGTGAIAGEALNQ